MYPACIIFVNNLGNKPICFFVCFRKYEYKMFFPIPMQLYLMYIYVEFIRSNVCFNLYF